MLRKVFRVKRRVILLVVAGLFLAYFGLAAKYWLDKRSLSQVAEQEIAFISEKMSKGSFTRPDLNNFLVKTKTFSCQNSSLFDWHSKILQPFNDIERACANQIERLAEVGRLVKIIDQHLEKDRRLAEAIDRLNKQIVETEDNDLEAFKLIWSEFSDQVRVIDQGIYYISSQISSGYSQILKANKDKNVKMFDEAKSHIESNFAKFKEFQLQKVEIKRAIEENKIEGGV